MMWECENGRILGLNSQIGFSDALNGKIEEQDLSSLGFPVTRKKMTGEVKDTLVFKVETADTTQERPFHNMRIFLSKDPSSQPGEILAHVEISPSDDPTKLIYSHSFKYKVPSGKDGEILVYADKESVFNNVKGNAFSFDLEKCRNKDCKAENPGGCPVIAGKGNRLLVADIFHTRPTQNTLQYLGTALFKALFSGEAGGLLRESKLMHRDDPIFLQLNDQDLDAIPWEYAKDGTTFLVHNRMFARIFGREHERPQGTLPKRPLRIVVAAPDPLDLTEMKLADLHLSDQVQNFINKFRGDSIKIMLERVLPATVNKMNSLLAKHNDDMATIFHFMGHCVSHEDDKGARGLLFEDEETFKCIIAKTQNLVTFPENLRLAFLSACDSREVARDLVQNGVWHTVGSYCPLPDDIARKSESQFYHYLVQGLSVSEAMWRTRMSFQGNKELGQSDYLAGAMILYSTTCQTTDNTFPHESGDLTIECNYIDIIPSPKKFFGRKKQLADLNGILQRMATRTNVSCNLCTITGIGGQGKTTLAIELIQRAGHFFPGGIFFWQFDDEKEISAKDYLLRMADVLFYKDPQHTLRPESGTDELETLGQVISRRFKASSLLILDHAETLKRAAAKNKKDAVFLVKWLKEIISSRNIAVKILATSQEDLEWSEEKPFPLEGFTDSDIHSGCKLFVGNLHPRAKEKIVKEENSKDLLRKFVKAVDGHPLTLKLLGSVVNSLEDITRENYCSMLVDSDDAKKSLEACFGPMIDGLSKPQRQILYLCCLFTGPITDEVLLLVSHFLDCSADDFSAEIIAAQLRILCERRLLKLTTKNDQYSIHIALWETVRRRNTELCLRLRLTSGQYDDVFFIGAPMASHSGAVLQWQLRMIQAGMDGGRARSFGIKYYNIVDIPSSYCLEKDFVPYLESVSGLVVFVRKATDPLRDDFPQFCKEKIVSIVEEKKLLFILCLKHVSAESSEDSNITKKNIALMAKAMETLMVCLRKTHFMIRAEPPIDILRSSRNFASTGNQKTYKDTVDVHMSGVFVGREKELLELNKLLKDKEHRFITIYGFGGTGKTALALQAVENFNSGKVLALSLVGVPKPSSLIKRIAGFLNIDNVEDSALRSKVLLKLKGEETILLYLDNVEDVKHAIETGDSKKKDDALILMKFFQCIPLNVKILATSRVRLGWPGENIVELGGLTPPDGMRVFLQWVTDSKRKSEIDHDNAMKLSNVVQGHALSLRLLGGVFDSSRDSIQNIINDISKRLLKAQDLQSIEGRHKSINSCIQYSFDYLDDDLKLLLKHLNIFETPFTSTLVMRALDCERRELWHLKWLNHAPSESSVATNLHILRRHSWLDQRIYKDDPVLGEWRPNIIKMDTEFYSLHPRLRDFINDLIRNSLRSRQSMPNDLELQFYIALCYGVGFGVVYDLERQLEWCRKAAKNGHLEAQLTLADCYEHGAGGVSEDQKEAFGWYLMAAEAGDKGAQEKISKRYRSGNGVEPNLIKCFEWFQCYNNNKGSPLNIKFKFSLPLLHREAEFGKEMLIRSLIEQSSAEVNMRDRYGRTPFYVAAEKGHMEILIMLAVEFRADVNIKDRSGRTPLHRAVEEGQIQIAKLLITELGADANAKDKYNQTPLHSVMKQKQFELVNPIMTKMLPRELTFDGGIGDEGARALGESLKQNTTITQLNLKNNDISAEGARALGESLKQNTTLTQLNLENNDIGAEGASALGESLKQNTSLTQLNLSDNGIGAEGTRALGESLKQNTTLTQLNLEKNSIGGSGARALGESLKQNTTFTELNLRNNRIGVEGAHALGESLRQNTTLTQLNLENNDIGAEGASALGESLKQNTSLTQLNLSYNGIGGEGVRALGESLKQNMTLIQLNLPRNSIGDSGARALGESLKQNTTLTQLNLSYNGIGAEGARALAESLKQNTTITQLTLEGNYSIGIELRRKVERRKVERLGS